MALLLSCTEAVTIGVWGHEAGNFSAGGVNRYPITSRLQAAYQPEEAVAQFTAYCFWPWEQTGTRSNRSIMAEQDKALSWP